MILLTPQLSCRAPQLTCGNGRISRNNNGPRRVRQHSRGVADLREQIDMTQVTPACARPTKRFPQGRTGTTAGYQAHRDAKEPSCRPCIEAHSARCLARRRSLSDEEMARFREENAAAHKRWRERDPEAARATKHRTIAKNRTAVHEAKNRQCADCGVQYPYYVMEFDHLDADAKHFNVSAGVTRASHERLLAEIAKCEVVCANCHAERTHQRKQTRKGAQADAVH